MSVRNLSVSVCAAMLLVGYAVADPTSETETPMALLPECIPDNGGLMLPEGFCALVVADTLGRMRHLDVAPNGDIYVRDRGNRGRDNYDPGGGIVALRDADNDGRAEIVERFADHYGTGLQLRGNYLYVSTTTEVYRYPMTPGQLVPQGEAEPIVTGFPDQRGHSSKAFAFDDAGHIYVNVGAPSNACMENSRTKGSRGMQPCPFLERQASVWRFDADRIGQTHEADGYKFVTGTRNIVAIAWDPNTRAIYAVQHGRDAVGSLWPEYFDDEDNAELPSEELFRLADGSNFGWPFCYHDRFKSRRILAPEYGGDGQAIGECDRYDPPLVAFPGHWAPDDLLFYTGDQVPERYRNGAFVVFHGSWNRAPLEQGGYQVAFAPMIDGMFNGDYETFAGGFAGRTVLMQPQNAVHRPVGIAQGPDGSIYVSDDARGRIWRIVYTGNQS